MVPDHKDVLKAKNSKRLYEIKGILTEIDGFDYLYGEIKVTKKARKQTRSIKFYAYGPGGYNSVAKLNPNWKANLTGHFKKVVGSDGKKHLIFCPIGRITSFEKTPETIKELIEKGINPKVDRNGNTYLHQLAESGELNQCNPSLLTKENLSIENREGVNTYHRAASRGYFNLIPENLIDESTLTKGGWKGETCIHYLAKEGQLGLIKKYLKPQHLSDLRSSFRETPLFNAASFGNFDKVPEDLITEKGLLVTNEKDKDIFYTLAERKKLKLLPKEFRTKELYSRKRYLNQLACPPNTNGTTVYHEAAKFDWSQIDDHLISKDVLMLKNSSGYTVLSQLPKKHKIECLALFSKNEIFSMNPEFDLGFNEKQFKEFKLKTKMLKILNEEKNIINIDI